MEIFNWRKKKQQEQQYDQGIQKVLAGVRASREVGKAVEEESEEETESSIRDYIKNGRINPERSVINYEPERVFVTGHATNFNSLLNAVLDGELLSPKLAQQLGKSLEIYTGHSPEEVSAYVGTISALYTKSGVNNRDEQAGFLFPTKDLPNFTIGYHGSGVGGKNFESLATSFNEELYDSYSSKGIEIGIEERLPLKNALIVVRETRVQELKQKISEKMVQEGKTEEETESILKRVWGFNSRFKNIDEATGWLVSTPEGKSVLKEKIGMDIPERENLPEVNRERAIRKNERRIEEWERALSRQSPYKESIEARIKKHRELIEQLEK